MSSWIRFARLAVACGFATASAAARADTIAVREPFDVASLTLMGAGAATDGSGYSPPAITSFAMLGDSRIQNAISANPSGATLQEYENVVLGYAEWAIFGSGNNLLPTLSSPYGVGATTSLNALDRAFSTSNYGGMTIGSTVASTATGAETAAALSSGNGGFPGYLTPGSLASPGTVTVTFGTAGGVSSSCGTGSGYTLFTVTDSNSDSIGSSCVANSASATKTFGGSQTAHNAYANFTVTQPSSGTLAQNGDNFTFTVFGPQSRSYSITGDATGSAVDAQFNTLGSGGYTPVTDRANAALIVNSINDSAYAAFSSPASGAAYGQCPGPNYGATYPSMPATAPCLSMVDIAAMLDGFKANGKIVFLADEAPMGMSLAQLEAHSVAAAATTVTATNASTFKYDGNSFSGSTTSLGQAVANMPGLIGVVTGSSTPTVYTQVASAPGVGQYSVSAAGVYTISASDPLSTTGGTAYLTYAYGSGSTGSYQLAMHAWLSSSAADFAYAGTDYHFPGALYNRPYVVSVPLFEALVDQRGGNWSASDPTCLTHACAAIPGALDSLAKHPTPYGGALFKQAFKQAWNSVPAYAALADNSQMPAYDNIRCAKSTGAVGPYACTMPPTMYSSGHPSARLCYGSAPTCVDESGGAFTNSDISASSVNYATGAVSVTFASGHTPTTNTMLDLYEDKTNALPNPLFDSTPGVGYSGDNATAPCIGSGVAYMPAGWACTVSGNTGLTVTWSTGTNSSGFPTLTATITGVATASGTLTVTNSAWGDTPGIAVIKGQKARAGLVETFGQYNGYLYGVYGAPLLVTTNVSSATYPNYYAISGNTSALVAFTALKLVAGQDATSSLFPFSDELINGIAGNGSGMTLSLLSLPIDLTGFTLSTAQALSGQITWAAGPVNGSVTFAQAQIRVRN